MSTDEQRGGVDRRLPLGVLLAAGVGAALMAVPTGALEQPLRFVFGFFAVFFVPGYAMVMALFPRRKPDTSGLPGQGVLVPTRVTTVERLVLSIALSVCLVPLLGLALDFTTIGITGGGLLFVVGSTTVALSVVALVRWFALPRSERFGVPVRVGAETVRGWVLSGGSQAERALNLVLIVGLLVSAGGIAMAVAAPNGERYTAFYLLSEDEDGTLVADGYPETLAPGTQVYVGIVNEEAVTTDYTVLVRLQELQDGTVVREETVDRFTTRLAPGERLEEPRTLDPAFAGEDLRLTFLLYRGDAPAVVDSDDAYRQAHVWVSVPEEGS